MEWNIKGIAESVIREMKEDNANFAELDYYLDDAFRSIQSRQPAKAKLVIEQVREYIDEHHKE